MAAIVRKCSFSIANKHVHLAILYICIFRLNSPHHIAYHGTETKYEDNFMLIVLMLEIFTVVR